MNVFSSSEAVFLYECGGSELGSESGFTETRPCTSLFPHDTLYWAPIDVVTQGTILPRY